MSDGELSYSERQARQLEKFLAWQHKEGGHELPTQLATLFQKNQLARLEWLKLNVTGRVLECGTNFGFVVSYVANYPILSGHAGVDIEGANVALAQVLNPAIEYKVADIQYLPYPDKSFDTLIVPETLEHLNFEKEVPRAVAEAHRVARKRILVTMPDGRHNTLEACNLKHRYLLDTEYLAKLRAMFEKPAAVTWVAGFCCLRCDLEDDL